MYVIIHHVSGRGGSRKINSSFQEVMGRGTNHTSKILSLQSKEVPTDVYWVKVKVLATLILMCDHLLTVIGGMQCTSVVAF